MEIPIYKNKKRQKLRVSECPFILRTQLRYPHFTQNYDHFQ